MARGFDAWAPCYDAVAGVSLLGTLGRVSRRFFGDLARRGYRRVVVLGAGTGAFLPWLAEDAPALQVDLVDLSPGMLARAARRAGAVPRLGGCAFHLAEAGDFLAGPVYAAGGCQAVVAPFFLDMFPAEEVTRLVRLSARGAPAGGPVWHVLDFHVPAGPSWRRAACGALVGVMYGLFRVTCGLTVRGLPPLGPAFAAAGLGLAESKTSCGGLYWEGRFEPGRSG